MRVVLYLTEPSYTWLAGAAGIAGMRKSQFLDRLIRYQAGGMSAPEEVAMEEVLQVCIDNLAVNFAEE